MASIHPPSCAKSVFDDDGFMLLPESWTETTAEEIAHQDGFTTLSREHWNIIHTLRKHCHDFGEALPAFRHVCFVNHLGKHCVDELFHSQREAWRIAGLPNPGEEAKSYM